MSATSTSDLWCRQKPTYTSENRIRGFSATSADFTLSTWSQVAAPHQETETNISTCAIGVFSWLSKDPIGISGGLNQYEAFNNSPVNRTDAFGLRDGSSHVQRFNDDFDYWTGFGDQQRADIADARNKADGLIDGGFEVHKASISAYFFRWGKGSKLKLPRSGKTLIAGCQDDVVLGVIDSKGRLNLFKAAAGGIEGHSDLVKAGLIPASGVQGFSLAVKNGKVVGLNRASMLNEGRENFQLADDVVEAILGLVQ